MLLKIENIECSMASTDILRSCSLEVNEGEIVSLVGRNGAGKSSILKNIIGLYPTRAGKILFKGHDITALTSHDRVTLGVSFSPEDSRLFPGLTVIENIQLGLWIAAKGEKTGTFSLERAFEIFPALKHLSNRKTDSLSGGEKKMVSISRALALSPSLLLLDESFEGLSPVVVKTFGAAMENIREDFGVSILLAESSLHNASQVATRIYVIERGEIIFEGPPSKIIDDEQLLKLVGK